MAILTVNFADINNELVNLALLFAFNFNPITFMQKKISIILTEDQELMRKSLAALINDFPEFSVIGEAPNGKELLRLLKTSTPDIVLLDIDMPVMNGNETLDILNVRFPEVKVIMLSMYNEEGVILDFMTRGARAYLPKGCDVEMLTTTIESVHRNGYHFSDHVSKAMLNGVMRDRSLSHIAGELALTDREMEIVKELCEGKTNKEIANQLKVTTRTVDFHRANIYAKTKSRNVAELVKYAIRHGVV